MLVKNINSQVHLCSYKFSESLSLITLNQQFPILNIRICYQKIIFKTQIYKKETKETNKDGFNKTICFKWLLKGSTSVAQASNRSPSYRFWYAVVSKSCAAAEKTGSSMINYSLSLKAPSNAGRIKWRSWNTFSRAFSVSPVLKV